MPIIAKIKDAETGDEIIIFERLGRRVAMVRDIRTKRFIRGVRALTLSLPFVFDYTPQITPRPLYIDAKVKTIITIYDIPVSEAIEEQMERAGRNVITSKFNRRVADLASPKGVEITSVVSGYSYPDAEVIIVWHHYKNDEKEESVVVRL